MTDKDCYGIKFPELKNDLILRAARGEKTERVPVWIMRQAGRYLPEFRELRAKHDFFEICENPELACKVTLMPIERFDLDAAIIFSDILVIPQAMGMKCLMTTEGPKFPKPLDMNEKLINQINLTTRLEWRLNYVYTAITLARHALEGKVPLIGFSGGPWTLMCYMIEGGGSKTMSKAKKWFYQEPWQALLLLGHLSDRIIDHLYQQVKAGAQMLQIFESNSEYLDHDLFEEYVQPYLLRICEGVKKSLAKFGYKQVPIAVFPKGGHHLLETLGKRDDVIDVLSLDWTIKPEKARSLTNICLQGNLDPCAMYCTESDKLERKVKRMLKAFGTQKFIANLGHGIYPDADMDAVKTFIDAVHSGIVPGEDYSIEKYRA